MQWKDSLLDRLPYYWDGENIDSFMSVLATVLDESSDAIESIRKAGRLDEIIEGEDIAKGDNLDELALNVGVVRDLTSFIDDKTNIDVQPENDEMLRNRAKWNISLQQSDALTYQIKELFTEGLVMFRVRTGFGGTVRENDLSPDDFTHPKGPKYDFADEELNRESVNISPSDILVFENRETMVGAEAPDYSHGKFGNLTNFYQIGIPWKAMPWAEGDNDLRWNSEDDWIRHHYETFTSDDIDNETLTLDSKLDKTDYPIVDVFNEENEKVKLDEVTSDGESVSIDLSDYDVTDEWSVRLSGDDGHRLNFTDGDLSESVLTVNHNLEFSYPLVSVYDDSGEFIDPDYVKYTDTTTVEIDLSSFSVSGIWHVTLAGGHNSRNFHKSFTSDDMTVREITFDHYLGVDSLNVQVFDNNDELFEPMLVQHIDDDTTYLKFSSEDVVSGEWNIQITADGVEPPTADKNGWTESVWGGVEEELQVEPLRQLSDLTRPAATEVGIYGYGGMIWRSEDDWDETPNEDELHGWGARWDGDVEEREYYEKQEMGD